MTELPESYLAIDIGGTKVAAGVVRHDGAVLAHRVDATPHETGALSFLDVVLALATAVLDETGGRIAGCGVGCGGPMDADTVSPLNIPAWRGFPLAASLHAALGVTVTVENDAKALALAEGWLGAARSRHDFLAMVVSTGVGGGIVLNRRLLDGRLGNAGHIGHVIVEPDGRRCPCGARGCLEAEASGTAIMAATGFAPRDAPAEVVARTGALVGRAVASVASLLDLDLAVVGGSVALGFGEPFFAAAQAELSARARLEFSRDCRVEPVGLGTLAPIVGAAAVAMRRDGSPGVPG